MMLRSGKTNKVEPFLLEAIHDDLEQLGRASVHRCGATVDVEVLQPDVIWIRELRELNACEI